jgi:hypothetical protein
MKAFCQDTMNWFTMIQLLLPTLWLFVRSSKTLLSVELYMTLMLRMPLSSIRRTAPFSSLKRHLVGYMLLNPKHHILLLTRPVCRNSRLCIRMQPTSLSLLSRRIVWVIQNVSISMPSLPDKSITWWVPLLLKISSISSMLEESGTAILLPKMLKLLRRSLALMFLN